MTIVKDDDYPETIRVDQLNDHDAAMVKAASEGGLTRFCIVLPSKDTTPAVVAIGTYVISYELPERHWYGLSADMTFLIRYFCTD